MTALAHRLWRISYIPPLSGLFLVLGFMVFAQVVTVHLYSPAKAEGDGLLFQTAHAVAAGDGYKACDPGYFPFCQPDDPTAAREPLPVSLFAVALRLSISPTVMLTLFNLCTGLLLYYFSCQLFSDRRIALLTLAVWAVYVPMLKFVTLYRAEPILALVLALTLFTFRNALEHPRWWRFALAGGYLGLAVLTRSALLYALLIIPFGYWLSSGRALRPTVSRMAWYALGVGLVMTPWVVRNAVVFGGFVPTSTLNGYNLFRHNYPVSSGNLFHYMHQEEAADVILPMLAVRGDVNGKENELQMDRIYRDEALKIIRARPLRYLTLVAYRFVFRQWLDVGVGGSGPTQWLITLSNLVLLPLAIWDILRLPKDMVRLAWPLVGAIVYFSLIYPPVVANFRFMVPLMPYVLLFALHRLMVIHRERAPVLLHSILRAL